MYAAEVFEVVSTTRHGLVTVNGSDGFGGCPLICRREAGGIDVCDCQPNDLTNFLVNGVIPDIGNPNGSNTWASQLFTVERTVRNTAVIGFDLGVPVLPTTVVITMFNCPPWDIYADTITVYSSILFPTLSLNMFVTPVGSISPGCTSCDSLLTFHVPVDVSSGISFYYVEFSDTSPDSTSREWVHLAEISFTNNDPPPPTPDPNTPAPNCTIIPTTTITSSPTPTSSSSMMTTGRSGNIMIRYASMSVRVYCHYIYVPLSLYVSYVYVLPPVCFTLSFVYPESSSTSQTQKSSTITVSETQQLASSSVLSPITSSKTLVESSTSLQTQPSTTSEGRHVCSSLRQSSSHCVCI